MNARKWTVTLSGLVAIAALATTTTSMAGLLDLFTYKPPVQVRVRMGSSGFETSQPFRITRYCSYNVDLRLLHTQNRMGEFDSLLANESLPLPVTVDVYRVDAERADRVAHLSGMPQLTGHAPSMTILRIGNVKLDRGRYRMEVSSTGEASQLAGIEADLVMQIPPKATCPRKGNT